MAAGDVALPADLGDHRSVWPDLCQRGDSPGEGAAAAQNALDDDRLPLLELAFGMVQRQPRRDARASRRAVDLGVGEDADIAAVVAWVLGWAGQDRAIEEA